jgi:cyanophycinase
MRVRTADERPSLKTSGTLALLGGGEWTDKSRAVDERLLERAKDKEVLVLPTAAAFENPDQAVERATAYLESLGAQVRGLMVVNRRDAEAETNVAAVKDAKFVYFADGSPLHLRSVLKGSALFDAIVRGYQGGGVLAASGAAATVICDPMVDPRGGAYTVGLGLVSGLAVFPYHGTAADHIRERSIDLLSNDAVLAGVDEHTALVRAGEGDWEVVGSGRVAIYRGGSKAKTFKAGATVDLTTP